MGKKMRVLAAMLLAVCMVFAGCGKGGGTEKPGDNPTVDGDGFFENGWIQDYTPYDKVDTREGVDTKLVVYEGPSYRDDLFYPYPGVEISVEDRELFVYTTKVNHNRQSGNRPNTDAPMTYFDFEGEVTVKITLPNETVESALVRPLGYGITPEISADKKTVSFTINRQSQYVVEVNGDPKTAIHIFANPLETDVPDPENLPENMIYFGPGVHKADAIPVKSGTTVYVAGGAVVYGNVHANGMSDITVRGRGIIDGTAYDRYPRERVPLNFMNSRRIKVEGIILSNPAGWTLNSYFVDQAIYQNVKIISSRENGDGITMQSCKNMLVRDCFVRGWDDNLVVKNYDKGVSENIFFNNCILWTDLAQSTEIGYETYGETMKNIMFRNITVLHNFHKPIISIHNSDYADISDVTYQNYTVEDASMGGNLIEMQVQYDSVWSKPYPERGSVKDVRLDNMLVLSGREGAITGSISGYSADRRISNVTISNLKVKDTEVRSLADGNFTVNQANTSNIKVEYTKAPTGAILTAPITNASAAEPVVTVKETLKNQDSYLVPEFAILVPKEVNMGDNKAVAVTATSAEGEFAAALAMDGDRETYWQSAGEPSSVATAEALIVDVGSDLKIKHMKLRMPEKLRSQKIKFNVLGSKAATPDAFAGNIVEATAEYELDPAKGNLITVSLNPVTGYRYYRIGFTKCSLGKVTVGEVEMYEASLSLNKPVTAENFAGGEQAYAPSKITDGDVMTYWEGERDVFPNSFTIDLLDTYNVTSIVNNFPFSNQQEARTMEIEILYSTDGVNFEVLVAKAAYYFDVEEGHVAEVFIDNPVPVRYLKFVGYSNSAWPAFQCGEISVYDNVVQK